MRWVMTRVLPLPAPARMRTGPFGGQHRLALLRVQPVEEREGAAINDRVYSTVTDFARFRGWSTSRPARTATW